MGSVGNRSTATTLSTRTVLSGDLTAYGTEGTYGRELADFVKEYEIPVYQISYNGGQAFADVEERANELYINMMASTGNRAGTELLTQVAEKALSQGVGLGWSADVTSAQQYYQHIGANQYATEYRVTTRYEVSNKDLPEFIRKLRNS